MSCSLKSTLLFFDVPNLKYGILPFRIYLSSVCFDIFNSSQTLFLSIIFSTCSPLLHIHYKSYKSICQHFLQNLFLIFYKKRRALRSLWKNGSRPNLIRVFSVYTYPPLREVTYSFPLWQGSPRGIISATAVLQGFPCSFNIAYTFLIVNNFKKKKSLNSHKI